MPVPSKGLRKEQIQLLEEAGPVANSSNKVRDAEFIDVDNVRVRGFYKPLSLDYPCLLAKISVAYSVFLRMLFGPHVAEDRLVFDQAGEIIGTFSYRLHDFKPMLCLGDALPEDRREGQLRSPDVATLLLHNFTQILMAEFFSRNNDGHPGNVGIALEETESALQKPKKIYVILDHDMRGYYPLTRYIKGPRSSTGIIEEVPDSSHIKSCYLDNFPNEIPATHSPAHSVPGNWYLPKRYRNYAPFQNLAKNPKIATSEGIISFQDQMFTAVLQILLLYDENRLKAWLVEYFGEVPLHYLQLDASKCEKLNRAYPHWFNETTNEAPFVDIIMAFFQSEYDEYYNASVYYPGCVKNKSGVRVQSFEQFLRNRPLAFHQIFQWAEEQNKAMERCWERKIHNRGEAPDVLPSKPEGWYYIAPEHRFHKKQIEQRYHQIWRHSKLLVLKEIFFEFKSLTQKLSQKSKMGALQVSQELKPSMGECKEARSTDFNCDSDSDASTTTWELVDKLTADRIRLLENFISELQHCSVTYYNVRLHQLRKKHNAVFDKTVHSILLTYKMNLSKKLKDSLWAGEFMRIITRLSELSLFFQGQLMAQNTPFDLNADNEPLLLLADKHCEPEVIHMTIESLFAWVDKLDARALKNMVFNVVENCYRPSRLNVAAKRMRADAVLEYLETSQESSANKLAYIFTVGGVHNNSLNTLIIRQFLPQVLNATLDAIDIHLFSLLQALDHNFFAEELYTKEIVSYAKTHEGFSHTHAKSQVVRFNAALYLWVESITQEKFKSIITAVLQAYMPYSLNWFSQKTRGLSIQKYLKEPHENKALLALIFKEGDTKNSSFNTLLLRKILDEMHQDASLKTTDNPDYLWLLSLDFSPDNAFQHFNYFLESLKNYAQENSQAAFEFEEDGDDFCLGEVCVQ